MRSVKWIVWDLGGVVIHLRFKDMLKQAQERYGIGEADLSPIIRETFSTEPVDYSLTEQAVCGLISKKDYIEQIRLALGNRVDEQAIEQMLQFIIGDEKADTVSLIRQLAANGFRQACMSNIDMTHWEKVRQLPHISELFEKRFLSFEQQLVKPHFSAYARLLELLSCDKDELIFIDDREDNVRSAINFGIRAIQYVDHASLKQALAPHIT